MNLQFITDGLLFVLVQLQLLTGNLGLSILLFTLIVRLLLFPLSIPMAQSQKKMKLMQPELDKLKVKHKNDKKALQLAQMELYKKYNLNPLAGCLPQVLQIALLFLLYRVFISFLSNPVVNGIKIDPNFLWLDLTKPDGKFILPVLAAATQLILSIMILPGGETPDTIPGKSKSTLTTQKEDEEKTAEMAHMMQQQMLFVAPVMTGLLALRFPSGLALYWVFTTIFSIVQQYFLVGPGGIFEYYRKVRSIKLKSILGGKKA